MMAPTNRVEKKAAHKWIVLGPLHNNRSGLSITEAVLLHRQLVRPLMDYACPVWRSADRSRARKLQMLQFMRLGIVTNVS